MPDACTCIPGTFDMYERESTAPLLALANSVINPWIALSSSDRHVLGLLLCAGVIVLLCSVPFYAVLVVL